MKRKVLVTGASGFVGRHIIPTLSGRYALRLLDINAMDQALVCERVIADITNFDAVLTACDGIDTVIHLAAEPGIEASFEELLQPNIVGLYNVFEAARQAGCSRVVFASSINVVMAYPGTVSITPDLPVNPSNLYGVTKCYGEALARHYANGGLSSICMRIGQIRLASDSFKNAPGDPYAGAWISTRDLAALFDLCVSVENISFEIIHAQSRHARSRLSIDSTCSALAYTPQDSSIG